MISPETVLAAYQQTGLTPKQGVPDFIRDNHACAVGALTKALVSGIRTDKTFFSTMETHYGLSPDEYFLFVMGFDGNADAVEEADLTSEAYRAGEAAWKAVQHLAHES